MAINGVVYDNLGASARSMDHTDKRRSLITVFNGDLEGFVAYQTKLTTMLKEAVLGGHYHRYAELFFIIEGNGAFDLLDINSKESEHYEVRPGSRLLIPAQVAHKSTLSEGTKLLGSTAEIYISPAHNDVPYPF